MYNKWSEYGVYTCIYMDKMANIEWDSFVVCYEYKGNTSRMHLMHVEINLRIPGWLITITGWQIKAGKL